MDRKLTHLYFSLLKFDIIIILELDFQQANHFLTVNYSKKKLNFN